MKPIISVVVPAYNNASGIEKVITSLINQSLLDQLFEIIIVDNGSSDETMTILNSYLKQYPDRIKVLCENKIRGSYAARNKGLSEAQGEIIAMTDSDCIPSRVWLEEGVNTLRSQNAHLVGGKVTFFTSEDQKPAEIYDAIKNLQVEYYIQEKNAAPTANLFALRSVFDKIGLFDTNLKSGGDYKWTRMATREGFILVYSPKAEVLHPTRNMKELLKKHYRIGDGVLSAWKLQGMNNFDIMKSFMLGFFPNKPGKIKKLILENGRPEMNKKFYSIWLIAWLCNIATNFGVIRYYLFHDRISL